MPKKSLTVRLDPVTRQLLDEVAEIRKKTRSEILEGLVKQYLRQAVTDLDVRDALKKIHKKTKKNLKKK